MKKSLFGLLAIMLVAGVVPVSSASAAELDVSAGCTLLTTHLEVGSKGAEVLALETFLKKEGHLRGNASSVFNGSTKKALIAFQLKAGLIKKASDNAAGKTGAPTREAISKASCKKVELQGAGNCVYLTRNLARENNEAVFVDDIKKLQRVLVSKKYLNATDITGFFGPVTRAAVVNFQLDNGLIPSRTSDAAGIVGPATRQWIQNNTCGDAVIANTATQTVSSFSAGVKTLKNVHATSMAGDRIMTVTLTPREGNATLKQIKLRVETDDNDVAPASRIEYIDLFHAGSGIVSRNRAASANWVKVDGSTYDIVLDGANEELDKAEENDFSIFIVAKTSQRGSEKTTFSAIIPDDGVRIAFDNVNDVNLGARTWGAPSVEATFYTGKNAESEDDITTTTIDTTGSDDNEEDTTTVVAPPVIKAPILQNISPDTGSFGDYVTLTGKHFTPTGNDILIKHPASNSETTLRNFPARGDKIIINFPGRTRDFVRPNGTKVSGKTGNYRIQVISNGKASNGETFRINP
jgi:peptidoglycan hydrolase-like protein with peptidoglycan-binding domain